MRRRRRLPWFGPASGSHCRLASRIARKPADQAHDARHDLWPQQARVVTGEAPLVLLETDVDQPADRQIDIGDGLAAGQGEVVVLRRLSLARADAARQPDALP